MGSQDCGAVSGPLISFILRQIAAFLKIFGEVVCVQIYGIVKAIVQLSLDLTDLSEALRTGDLAVQAGVDWLEVGTPLIIAEGMRGIRELRTRYPEIPIVADLKTMD